MATIEVKTDARQQMLDITAEVSRVVRESGTRDGICLVFTPHTTAAVTINENADPAVVHDMLLGLNRISPEVGDYRHGEGNSDAHIKSSLVGASELVAVNSGSLALGTWQGIYFCEFDGPRRRRVEVSILPTVSRD